MAKTAGRPASFRILAGMPVVIGRNEAGGRGEVAALQE